MYLQRATGLSLTDFERMTVRDVLDSSEGKSADAISSKCNISPEVEPVEVAELEPTVEPVTVTEIPSPDFRAALRETLYGTPEEQLRSVLRAALA